MHRNAKSTQFFPNLSMYFIILYLGFFYPQTHLPDHQYVFTRLNLLLDRMAASDSLTHAVSDPSSLTPTSGVILQSSSSQAIGAGASCLVEAGVFASASMVAMRSRKEVELNELCVTMLSKLPKAWNRVSCFLDSTHTWRVTWPMNRGFLDTRNSKKCGYTLD